MTLSGTTTFDVDMVEAIEEAFERCGLESRNGWDARTARRSINFMLADWANRGQNMWAVEERNQTLTYGDGEYTLGTDVVDLIETMIQLPATGADGGPIRYNCDRVSVSQHATRVNPGLLGRPIEIYINRQQAAPVVHLWPLPGEGGPFVLNYWVLRRFDDAGAYTNTADVPFRFLPAFISGLAYHVAEKKRTDDPNLILRLQQRYEADWQRAADEDREKATWRQVPKGSSYRVT